LPNLLKDYKITYLSLPKIVIYCIPPLGDMVHRKRALIFFYMLHDQGNLFQLSAAL
jgi:hypothetical protein